MLKVEDVMTKDVIAVKQETPIYEAMAVMRKNDITGMPVIDDEMTLVGVITEKDVLRLFCGDEDDKNKTVGFFMTRPAVSYRENENLQSVCDFMMVNYFRRVPVVSKKSKLVGIISRPDIIDYIIEQRQQTAQTHSKTSCVSSAT
ncbi:MAG: CBS domain-containing protein [Planctomycetes bacterium]|nr:CBS domain-containing protein [Planctomycetota bacterium]